MKAVKRNKILLVVALTLVLSLTVGLTLAYFSDYTEAKGSKVVTLGGRTEINEVPGDNSKNIKIKNTGETEVIVRVAVYGPGEIRYTKTDGWSRSGDYWYYNSVLKPTEETSPLIAEWDVPTDIAGDYNVVVAHESEMAVYDGDKVAKPTGCKPDWALVPGAN